jgi:hypothetical protein
MCEKTITVNVAALRGLLDLLSNFERQLEGGTFIIAPNSATAASIETHASGITAVLLDAGEL